jgi:3D (Asp-Asp-Asp) domain-containing protein
VVEQFKKHWFASLFALCAVIAGATWEVAVKILVDPRDFEIARLQRQLDQLKAKQLVPVMTVGSADRDTTVLSETGVFENSAVTTSDGVRTIQIVQVRDNDLTMSVIAGSERPQTFENLRPGSRVTVQAQGALYFVDIHRIRGNIIDLAVYRGAH